jgi:hypothetical protein
VECYWPEFTVWKFIFLLLDYQVSLLQKVIGKHD